MPVGPRQKTYFVIICVGFLAVTLTVIGCGSNISSRDKRSDRPTRSDVHDFIGQYQGQDGDYGFTGGAIALSYGAEESPAESGIGCARCRNGGVAHAGNLAKLAETSEDVLMEPTTRLQWASNSKVFTAAMILKMSDLGILDIDKGVDKYLTEAISARLVCRGSAFPTVRQVMRMGSGWTEVLNSDALTQVMPRCQDSRQWSRTEIIDKNLNGSYVAGSTCFPPSNSGGNYTNLNYIVLSWIIEDYNPWASMNSNFEFVVQAFLHEYIRDQDGNPLKDTLAPSHCDPESIADGYDREDGSGQPGSGLVPVPCSLWKCVYNTTTCNFDKYNKEFTSEGRSLFTKSTCSIAPTGVAGAAGVVSSAHDMATWIRQLFMPGETILSHSSLKELSGLSIHGSGGFVDLSQLLPMLSTSGKCRPGVTFPSALPGKFLGHAGTFPGYHSVAMFAVEYNASFALIWNSAPYKSVRADTSQPQTFIEWFCVVGELLERFFPTTSGTTIDSPLITLNL